MHALSTGIRVHAHSLHAWKITVYILVKKIAYHVKLHKNGKLKYSSTHNKLDTLVIPAI